MKEEQVILVNQNDEEIGLAPKMKAHEEAWLHRAFSVFIFNDQGKLLLQQRAADKYHSPKLWTNTVCSHQRQGESNIEAGKRRLMEEMGMKAPLRELFHFIYKAPFDNGLTEHELDHVMIGFDNINPIINPDEVMDFRWESLENIQKDISRHPEKYTEWFKIIFANSYENLQVALEEKLLQNPIMFTPIFKEKPWGGQKLKSILHKPIPSDKTGESWEISTVPNNVSVVSDGFFKDKSLQWLIDKFKDKLLGKKVYESFQNNFPLLIKYIDAADDLSVQVHPNDALAKKKHASFGKNELWYVMQADEGGALYIGFKQDVDKDLYLQRLADGNLAEILHKINVKQGDVFYIPAGTVHAIGKGVLLAEIQQTSDVTYRIFDWNRLGLDEKPRKLHIAEALEAIDFDLQPDQREETFIETPYFKIENKDVEQDVELDFTDKKSFVILMNVGDGDFEVDKQSFGTGQSMLIPAVLDKLSIKCHQQGKILIISI